MQQHQMRPVHGAATLQPDDHSGFVVMPLDALPLNQAIMAPKRVTRDQRGEASNRFGPLPGEVFLDEAKFGSFN